MMKMFNNLIEHQGYAYVIRYKEVLKTRYRISIGKIV